MQVLELLGEGLVEVLFGAFGVEDGGLVVVVVEVAGGDEAVAAVVAGADGEEDFAAAAGGVVGVDWALLAVGPASHYLSAYHYIV